MRASNKSAAIRHSVQDIVDKPCPGGSIRAAVKGLLEDVIRALSARRSKLEAEMIRENVEHLDAIPFLSRGEEAAVRGLINLYKATVSEDREANVGPTINLNGLPAEALRELLSPARVVNVIEAKATVKELA